MLHYMSLITRLDLIAPLILLIKHSSFVNNIIVFGVMDINLQLDFQMIVRSI